MADIVLGIGASHSPMLSTPWEAFDGHADRDRARVPGFEALVRDKASWIGRELAPEVTRARHEATQAALAHLSRTLADAALDALIVVGDDQAEWFSADSQPALCIYWGDTVDNLPSPVDKMAPSLRRAYWGYYGDGTNRTFPVDAALARHLVEALTHEHEFDVAHVRVQPRHAPLGHAWSFVHQRLMGERIVPIVPVMLNTYFPPNQPTPGRCHRLGRAIRQVVAGWTGARRIGVLGSGGLSHFVVDEDFDQDCIDAIKARDVVRISQLPRGKLNSGNSEVRNWFVVAGATEHLDLDYLTYVPCYRSEAGTGCAMAFAEWS